MFILLAEDDGCGNAVLRRAGGRAREGEGIARPPTRSRLIANPRGLLVLRHGTLEVLSVVAIGVGLSRGVRLYQFNKSSSQHGRWATADDEMVVEVAS